MFLSDLEAPSGKGDDARRSTLMVSAPLPSLSISSIAQSQANGNKGRSKFSTTGLQLDRTAPAASFKMPAIIRRPRESLLSQQSRTAPGGGIPVDALVIGPSATGQPRRTRSVTASVGLGRFREDARAGVRSGGSASTTRRHEYTGRRGGQRSQGKRASRRRSESLPEPLFLTPRIARISTADPTMGRRGGSKSPAKASSTAVAPALAAGLNTAVGGDRVGGGSGGGDDAEQAGGAASPQPYMYQVDISGTSLEGMDTGILVEAKRTEYPAALGDPILPVPVSTMGEGYVPIGGQPGFVSAAARRETPAFRARFQISSSRPGSSLLQEAGPAVQIRGYTDTRPPLSARVTDRVQSTTQARATPPYRYRIDTGSIPPADLADEDEAAIVQRTSIMFTNGKGATTIGLL